VISLLERSRLLLKDGKFISFHLYTSYRSLQITWWTRQPGF
jgi:hypothetical protein